MPSDENGKRSQTRGERAVSWAKAASIMVAAGLAVYAAVFKGEPGADEAKSRVDKTWKEMKRDVRKLTQAYNKLHTRVIYFQAREEGHTSGALKAKLDQLQAKYDRVALSKKSQKSQVEALRGILDEERKLRDQKDQKKRADKAAKGAVQMQAPPTAPPWRKSK
jgi:hypothetical protein